MGNLDLTQIPNKRERRTLENALSILEKYNNSEIIKAQIAQNELNKYLWSVATTIDKSNGIIAEVLA